MSPPVSQRRMLRTRPRVLGGVCAGLAEHLHVSVQAVRTGMVVAALFGGAGIVLYFWLWLLVPDAADPARQPPAASVAGSILQRPGDAARTTSDPAPSTSRRFNPAVPLLIGVGLLALAIAVATGSVPLQILIPAAIAVVGLVLAWRRLISDGAAGTREVTWQVIGGAALVVVGVILLVLPGGEGRPTGVLGGALAVLAGAGVALAPWVVKVMRTLANERAERARANERADIAAHLHDSVLQSLALIRQKSAPDSDVARIARRQERELRDWLFVRDTGLTDEERAEPSDVGARLRAIAERLDEEHGCTFDVVTIGDVVVTGALRGSGGADALVAAANEAMTNAARHAGGRISVLVEGGVDAGAAAADAMPRRRLSVTVTDRGPGVDLGAIPDDRHGIRSSIIARMRRSGGQARITAGPGGHGTRVVLTLDEQDAMTTERGGR